ncbi:MAG: family 1 glycosylhydrolase [Anaerolineae bacterium]
MFLRRPALALPEDFLFGVACSDHQCEASDDPCHVDDIWDDWEKRTGRTPRGQATDFWDRCREDVSRASVMGCRAFRFSISWARVEPEPGHFSPEAIEHYVELAEHIKEVGMEPIVTLMHFVWPLHIEKRGGLLSPKFPSWFREYAAQVRSKLDRHVRYWLTFNEPNMLIFSFFKPWWLPSAISPPGISADVAALIRNLFLAHKEARTALRDGPGGEKNLVSANTYHFGLPPFLRDFIDRNVTAPKWLGKEEWRFEQSRQAMERPLWEKRIPQFLRDLLDSFWKTRSILFTFIASSWWYLGMLGRLPEFLCPPDCRDQCDYVAFDYYFGIRSLAPYRIPQLLAAIQRRFDEAPIWPDGLYDALLYYHKLFPGKQILIAENGIVDGHEGNKRPAYIKAHVRRVQQARWAGVNVIGYLVWSLTSNREWGLPFGPESDFGLYHIDLDNDPNLTRSETPAVNVYQKIISQDGVS